MVSCIITKILQKTSVRPGLVATYNHHLLHSWFHQNIAYNVSNTPLSALLISMYEYNYLPENCKNCPPGSTGSNSSTLRSRACSKYSPLSLIVSTVFLNGWVVNASPTVMLPKNRNFWLWYMFIWTIILLNASLFSDM